MRANSGTLKGLSSSARPRRWFQYDSEPAAVRQACSRYAGEVRGGAFPGPEESY